MPRLRLPKEPPRVLAEHVAERSRSSAHERVRRLTEAGRTVVHCAVSASLAWLVATEALGHTRPVFAPISAIVTLGLTFGARGRRAVELAFGVALGIGVADLLVALVGTGPAQLALVVAVAMSLALLLGSGQLFAVQAAVSGVLVTVLEFDAGGSPQRFLDALAGGAIALVVSALVLPADPLALVRRALEPLLAELAATLEDMAVALRERSWGRAERALLRARGLDPLASRLTETVEVSRETARMVPPRRGAIRPLDAYAAAAEQVDLAVRNVRVLGRGSLRAVRLEEHIPPEIALALRDLADAVRALGPGLQHTGSMFVVREPALRAAARATLVLERTANLSVSVIVGQVRSTAVDLLRGSGLSYEEALEAVLRAAREAEAAELRAP